MKSKTITSSVRVLSLLLLVSCACALAQDRRPMHFTGALNDFSPSTVKGGPWEMHGQWSLDLHKDWQTADFTADMTMSDLGLTSNNTPDPTQPGQNSHTHHIKLTGVMVTWDMTGCPAVSPATLMGFQINGTVSLLTANGSNAIFETNPPSSTLQVCVTGGDNIPYSVTSSNVSLVFLGPATGHFGTQPIHGVVRSVSVDSDSRDRDPHR